MKKMYYLMSNNGQKSFGNKAVVEIDDNGNETLYSYNTPIITRTKQGKLIKLYNGWSQTTGRHIKSFCGLNKTQFETL